MAKETPDESKKVEVSLDGGATTENTSSPEAPIAARHAHLEGLVAPGSDNAAVLDALLAIPKEKLIPWEIVEVPSKGLYYGWDNGNVEVCPWGSKVDKALSNSRLIQSGQVIPAILRDHCRFPPGFDINDLLVGDQVFLLYYLRGITHGNNYEFVHTCGNSDCGAQTIMNFDLNNLAATRQWANPALGNEPFKVELPYLSEAMGRSVWASVKFLRVRDVQNINNMKRAENKAGGGNIQVGRKTAQQKQAQPRDDGDQLLANLDSLIVDVMGVTDRFKIRQLINEDKIQATDLAAIRDWVDTNTPGIETTLTVTCGQCGTDQVIALPLTAEFFRPKKHGGLGP